MAPLLGVIADDFTGATDVAGLLVRAGLRTALHFDVPADGDAVDVGNVDAVVVALKTRSVPAAEAVARSLDACRWLQRLGVERFYFKYCSTFDSTDAGNIGPVAEALMDTLGVPRILFCPAFPENGRTVYRGHLFVGNRLLSESGMERHPLNPMTDPNLVRVLGRQSTRSVGLVPVWKVDHGPDALRAEFGARVAAGEPLIVCDAIDDGHLSSLAAAAADDRLVTGGSALAFHLAHEWQRRGRIPVPDVETTANDTSRSTAILAGSCSTATARQIAGFSGIHPDRVHRLDVDTVLRDESASAVATALDWASARLGDDPVLIHSSGTNAEPAEDPRLVAPVVERTLGRLAVGLVERGVGRLIVAGGESSGAVVAALGLRSANVGREIAPGVPWITTPDGRLQLALKSGNFGGDDFFLRAFEEPAR